jgi:hypothetical protein
MIGTRDGPSDIKDSENEIQCLQVMVGSKMYPEHPIMSHAKCFHNLRNAFGFQANSLPSIYIYIYVYIYIYIYIKGNEYRNSTFVVGCDIKKILGLAFTGVNTKKSLMSTKFKTNSGDYQASTMHIVLISQQVVEIDDNGITSFD